MKRFPAHAGMDPEHRDVLELERWFPRPRGDGPLNPASGDACRFPRPRGDGPCAAIRSLQNSRVSPPTRGWTHRLRGHRPTMVSPPTRGWTLLPYAAGCPEGFPRPRGDGPDKAGFPRPRGDPQRFTLAVAGFPAHAGMDPLQPSCRFPAHAGMDPDRPCGRFPRPRGDGPWRHRRRGVSVGFPRPRGDGPRSPIVHGGVSSGFPAHAGMDPSCRLRPGMPPRRLMPRFPRPRGDGPIERRAFL